MRSQREMGYSLWLDIPQSTISSQTGYLGNVRTGYPDTLIPKQLCYCKLQLLLVGVIGLW